MPSIFRSYPRRVCFPSNGIANHYGRNLLKDLGVVVTASTSPTCPGNENRWDQCGLAKLTGFPDSPLTDCPIPLAEYGDGVLNAFEALAGKKLGIGLAGADLMAMRANHNNYTRRGDVSPGGSCRILPSANGHIAVNLARESDWELLPAWLSQGTHFNWEEVAKCASMQNTEHLIDQGRLLGLAVANASPAPATTQQWYELSHHSKPVKTRKRPPRVLDLSSLWAGPLCGRLLQWAGAEVTKVESEHRPDGARFGPADFFNFLNDGKTKKTLDLSSEAGRETLRDLIRSSDIVIEASRPRALRQMGIIAESLIEEVPGLCWLSISGYGREEPQANWIAYGDDAGVAAGLSHILKQHTGRWMICGDAIADPLTGMHAALAALACWQAGGGQLLSLSLVQTLQHCTAYSSRASKE